MTSDEQFEALMSGIEYTAEELAEIEKLKAEADLAALKAEKDALAKKVADAYKGAEPNWQAHYAAKAKRNGVVYEADGVNGDGHTISWYRVLVEGKTILWASVDNDLVHANGPKGTTAHLITVWNATRTEGTTTTGTALRGPTKEGTRIFGQTVTSYVAPRAHRWIAQFYGV